MSLPSSAAPLLPRACENDFLTRYAVLPHPSYPDDSATPLPFLANVQKCTLRQLGYELRLPNPHGAAKVRERRFVNSAAGRAAPVTTARVQVKAQVNPVRRGGGTGGSNDPLIKALIHWLATGGSWPVDDRVRRDPRRLAALTLKARSKRKRPPTEAALQRKSIICRRRRRREIIALTPYPTPKPAPKILNNTSNTSSMASL